MIPWLPRRRRFPVVAVLRLGGVIGLRAGRGLTLAAQAALFERAFALKRLAAVALVINSPGGSAAQSALLHRRIRQLATEKTVPVFAFVEDVAASGGYWLACAGDEIYAEETSIVGSIGVVSAGFGLHELLRRFGIERRIYTAGARKGLLDPFLPENPDDIVRLKALQGDIHDSFKELVRARRGARLVGGDDELFSGEIFTGRTARAKGLVDGIGDVRSVMRARFGDDVALRLVGAQRRRFFYPFRFNVRRDPEAWLDAALATVEERLWWARFGL